MPENPSLLMVDDWRQGDAKPLVERRHRARKKVAFAVHKAESVLSDAKLAIVRTFEDLSTGRLPDVSSMRGTIDRIALVVEQNPFAVMTMTRLKSKHEYTFLHSVAVSALMMAVGRKLGLQRPAVRTLGLAGLLHDIGKSRIPKALLDKPTPLDADERRLIYSHAERGYDILSRIEGLDPVVLRVCRHHHERLDGRGYPDGLAGEQITQAVRIATVCDVFDALTSSRAYKEAWTPAKALGWMLSTEGQFDASLLLLLRSLLGAFPAGTYVRLESDRLGMVLADPDARSLTPRVSVDRCAITGRALPAKVVDTTIDPIIAVEPTGRWPELEEAVGHSSLHGVAQSA